MNKKKIKLLPLMLALFMALCVMPATPAKAATKALPVKIKSMGLLDSLNNKPKNFRNLIGSTGYYQAGFTGTSLIIDTTGATNKSYNLSVVVTRNGKTVHSESKSVVGDRITYKLPSLSSGEYRIAVTVKAPNASSYTANMTLRTFGSKYYTECARLNNSLDGYADCASLAYKMSTGSLNARGMANEVYKCIGRRLTSNPIDPYLDMNAEAYVADLYNGLLNRNYDKGGFDYWVNKIKAGNYSATVQKQVYDGFVYSAEYQNRMRNLGITW